MARTPAKSGTYETKDGSQEREFEFFLPNIGQGVTVSAKNEAEAIEKGKKIAENLAKHGAPLSPDEAKKPEATDGE